MTNGIDEEKTIAHLLFGRTLLSSVAGLVLAATVLVITFYHPAGTSVREYLDARGPWYYGVALSARVCCVLFALRQLWMLQYLRQHQRRAVWISANGVFYLSTASIFPRSMILRSDIRAISLKPQGQYYERGLLIELSGGRQRILATWLFEEPAELIRERLGAELAIA